MGSKVRVICVSAAVSAAKADSFQRHFRDLFKGKFLLSGKYMMNGDGGKFPLFYVVRLAKKDEPIISGFEMLVNPKDLYDSIPEVKRKAA